METKSFDEARITQDIDESAERYYDKYRPQMEALESCSALARTKGISPYDFYSVGKQLDKFNEYKALCEADGSVGDLGQLPNIALDVITVAYGSSVIPHIATIQPELQRAA